MILHTTPSSYVISHPRDVKYPSDSKVEYHCLNPTLFQIKVPFLSKTKEKEKDRKLCPTALQIEAIYNEEIRPYFETEIPANSAEHDSSSNSNAEVVSLAQSFFSNTDYEYEKFNGANPTDATVVTNFGGRSYVFPPNCAFFNCDLFQHQFDDLQKYDLIVLDPPWKNKFIRRRKGNKMGYDTHSTDDIGNLRLADILNPNGVVAIWTTNGRKESVLSEMLGKWGLKYHSVLYWLKVTKFGELTCPFTKQDGKQPFETLILATSSDDPCKGVKDNEEKRLIVSTPSAINSHKPPLTQVLEDYFGRKFESKCELFARYLLPGYSSFGNQVLKLNNILLFDLARDSD